MVREYVLVQIFVADMISSHDRELDIPNFFVLIYFLFSNKLWFRLKVFEMQAKSIVAMDWKQDG